MEYIHVKNLEKYHPGYKDRTLQWAKIHINMVQGDPDTELIDNEIDWGRLIKIILLELRAQKPLPNIDWYWRKNSFNIKNRPMSLTLKMLHNFLDTVHESVEICNVEKRREEKSKSVPVTGFSIPSVDEVKLLFKNDDLANSFYDYYTANGWKVGRNPMKDWLAAARNWQRRQREFQKNGNGKLVKKGHPYHA